MKPINDKRVTEMRVIDGLCPDNCTCTPTKQNGKDRITASYIEGKGDKKNLVQDVQLLQDLLYCSLEKLRIQVLETQTLIHGAHPNIYTFNGWLVKATYSISAYIHCIGQGEPIIDRHTLPYEAHAYLDNEGGWVPKTPEMLRDIGEWKERLGGKEEFGHYEGQVGQAARALDKCRVCTREVHTLYRAWKWHYEGDPQYQEGVHKTGVFLNRLSTYYEWAAREVAQGAGIGVSLWGSKMPEFPSRDRVLPITEVLE